MPVCTTVCVWIGGIRLDVSFLPMGENGRCIREGQADMFA